MSSYDLISNVLPRSDLIGLARKRKTDAETATVRLTELQDRLDAGWTVVRQTKTSARVSRTKRHDVHLEDRVWSLLYKMGFAALSGSGGAILTINPDASHRVTSQIDVVALDQEVCVAIECKASIERGRRPNLQQEMAKHALVREALARALNFPNHPKRTVALGFWAFNAVLSHNDRERAKEQGLTLFGTEDLAYYEALVGHLGPAARHQFLADLMPGRTIPGLSIRVPAIQAKMGGYRCYTFSVSPEYLLKIAYVSHRSRGKGSDLATYQRMVSRSRLRRIGRYISEPDAMFPTNVVINLEKGRKGAGSQFEKAQQQEGAEGAVFGWLTLRPTYKSAWVIDGQHRLFAYSGHPRSASSALSVLAFEGLPGSVQQKLFIDINAEQKSVKKSLLQELFADLHRGSDDPKKLTQALISEAIQELDRDPDSPFADRILLADSARTDTRCISMTSMYGALDRPGLFFGAVRDNMVVEPGPFWAKKDEVIVQRVTSTLNGWFGIIRDHVPEWWDLGAAEGGGLAMNDGVMIAINVLRSIVEHLESRRTRLAGLDIREIGRILEPYAQVLGDHFRSMSQQQRLEFRLLRGNQGQAAGLRHAQAHIQRAFPYFKPDGLEEFLEREKARTNEQAAALINDVERILGRTVVSTLKEQLGTEGDQWWYEGVPRSVRVPVGERQDDDKNAMGSREAYLDLIHYREIALYRWPLFATLLGYGRSGSKQRKTEWIVRVNEIRKIAMHASRGATVSFEQLAELNEYLTWLRDRSDGQGREGLDERDELDTDGGTSDLE